jgi:hypothetical protein
LEQPSDQLLIEILKTPILDRFPIQPHKISGHLQAFTYFYAFIRYVVPRFCERFKDMMSSPSGDKNSSVQMNVVKRMLIIIPESCEPPTELTYDDKVIHYGFLPMTANRTGEKNHDIKLSIYKVPTCQEGDVDIYFSGECPACLLTLAEIQSGELAGLTREKLYAERKVFQETLISLLTHPDNNECNVQCEVLLWPDPRTNRSDAINIHEFLQRTFRDRRLFVNQEALCINETYDETFCTVPCYGNSLVNAYIHSTVGCYDMMNHYRGVCLIISTTSTTESQQHVADLSNLFSERFGLEVRRYCAGQLIADDIRDKLQSVCTEFDHNERDVFVCCILSHGTLGLIRPSDGVKVSVIELAEYLNDANCPKLKGKPKLFFVHTYRFSVNNQFSMPAKGVDHCEHVSDADTHLNKAVTGMRLDSLSQRPENTSAPGIIREHDLISDIPVTADVRMKTLTMKSGELLTPHSPDYVISYSDLTSEQHSSVYIRALLDKLTANTDIVQALDNVRQQVKRQLLHTAPSGVAETDITFHVSTATKRIVFPPNRR